MGAPSMNELREFHIFVGERVNNGGAGLSPEEVLDEWRALHPPPTDPEDLEAIQEAIDDIESGDTGIPFEEFERKFRARHQLPPRS